MGCPGTAQTTPPLPGIAPSPHARCRPRRRTRHPGPAPSVSSCSPALRHSTPLHLPRRVSPQAVPFQLSNSALPLSLYGFCLAVRIHVCPFPGARWMGGHGRKGKHAAITCHRANSSSTLWRPTRKSVLHGCRSFPHVKGDQAGSETANWDLPVTPRRGKKRDGMQPFQDPR